MSKLLDNFLVSKKVPIKLNIGKMSVRVPVFTKVVTCLKCSLCDYKTSIHQNHGASLQKHLTEKHGFKFKKGQGKVVKQENGLIIMSNFNQENIESDVWECPYCKKYFFFSLDKSNKTSAISSHIKYCKLKKI